MRIVKPVFLLLVLALAQGCAHYVGYRGSYGYGGGYGTGYGTTGYGMQSYYGYPSSYYYRSAPVIHYDRRYSPPPRHPRHYDWRNDRHHSDNIKRPVERRNSNVSRRKPNRDDNIRQNMNMAPQRSRDIQHRPTPNASDGQQHRSTHTPSGFRNSRERSRDQRYR